MNFDLRPFFVGKNVILPLDLYIFAIPDRDLFKSTGIVFREVPKNLGLLIFVSVVLVPSLKVKNICRFRTPTSQA